MEAPLAIRSADRVPVLPRASLFGAELTVAILQRSPEIPTRDRCMRAPLRADLQNFFRRWPFAHAVRTLDRVLNSQIEVGQHIRPSEAKHQEHLRGPPADALYLDEVLDQIIVAHGLDRVE